MHKIWEEYRWGERICLKYVWPFYNIMHERVNTAYYLAKNERRIVKFGDLLTLQEKNWVKVSDMYRNERAGDRFFDNISTSIYQQLL